MSWLKGRIIQEGEKALLFKVDEFDKEVWIPLSQISSRKRKWIDVSDWFYDKLIMKYHKL